MKMRALIASVTVLVIPLSVAAELPADPAYGYWLTENRKAIVRIEPCGADTCGRMVWIENAVDDSGAPKRDIRNTDDAKRQRSICGLELVGGLIRTDSGTWENGWLYNPRDGGTYSAEIRAVSPSELEVRGYFGVSLLGSSQIWTRVGDDRGGCEL